MIELKKQDRGARRTYQVHLFQVALIEKKDDPNPPRTILQGGPTMLLPEKVVHHAAWRKDREFSLEVPDTSYLYGHPVQVKYMVNSIAEFGCLSREVEMSRFLEREKDFVASFSQRLTHLRKNPATQDFASVDRSGELLRMAQGVADSTCWPVTVTSVGLGYGSNGPFDPVKDKTKS